MSHDLTNFPAQPQLGLDIADILLTKGWVERVDGGLRLLNEATFWSSLSAVIRDLATVGCFPSQAWFRQVVMHGRASGDPATWFEVRDYRVRTPTLLDLPALLRLEEECWIEPLRASEAALRQRLENNPLGHLVAELHGQTAGVIYSQRIVDVDALFLTDFRAAAALHRQGGPIVQPLAVNVLPAMQHYGIGDQLLEFLLQLVTLQPDVDRVVAVTLCKLYKQHQDRPMEEYIHLRNEQGQLIDPILNFHASHGAKIRAVISGYRPADQDNQGKGVLVEYDLRNRWMPRSLTSEKEDRGVRSISALIEEAVLAVLGEQGRAAFSRHRPLKELGFDSFQLLELRTLLGQRLGVEFEPSIFFRHNTVEAITEYFQSREHPPSREGDARNEAASDLPNMPIAIIGMACRFPGGVTTPAEFWSLLEKGSDAISEVPPERWDIDSYHGEEPGQMRSRYGGFLDDVAGFDASFFRIAPTEAKTMDPQQRLLLETHVEALESAGINLSVLKGSKTGIFVGIFSDDYKLLQVKQSVALSPYFGTGTSISIAAGRVAYFLGTEGPALAVDTACSSSLVAVHLACQSLRTGETSLAMASGVNLLLSPELSVSFSQANMLAPDGRCKTFDAAANGYVRSEGCGVVVLKRLHDAQAAGDPILAVIRGTAVNQDGASNGLTAPNGLAQQALLRQALRAARLTPAEVGYVEAHGTGTPLGDPVEIEALEAVYGQGRTADQPLFVGSVKTNIGHAEAAAGIAGLIKAVLVLRNRYLPPHLHFRTISPYLVRSQVKIPVRGQPFLPTGNLLRVGVSSFGFSGTNAHVIVEEAAPPPRPRAEEGLRRSYHLLTLSAQTGEALRDLAERYAAALPAHPDSELPNIAYTTHCGRSHFRHRLAVVAATVREAQAMLAAFVDGQLVPGLCLGEVDGGKAAPRVAFLFTGQGSQYLGMGRELYETQPLFRERLDRCDAVLRECLGRSLIELFYPVKPPSHNDLIDSHPCGQAANFAIECALSDLFRSFGISPAAVLGHSLGDFAAAYTAGVFSLEDGLRLVIERGRLMERAPGSMVSVLCSEKEALHFLPAFPEVGIAAINAPTSVVLSGAHASVAALTAQLAAAGYKTRKLDIPIAAHSALLDPVLDAFADAVCGVTLAPPRIPVVSSMTGGRVHGELTDPAYWRQQLRNTVRFADGVAGLYAHGCTVFLEIGPKPTLLSMAEQCIGGEHASCPRLFLPSLSDKHHDWQQLLLSLGSLYAHGIEPDWQSLHEAPPPRRVSLPTYPFQRKPYWIDPAPAERTARKREGLTKEEGAHVQSLLYEPTWERQILPFAMRRTEPPGRWLILADTRGIGTVLANRLRAVGETVLVTTDARELGGRIVQLAAADDGLPLRGIVHLQAIDTAIDAASDDDAACDLPLFMQLQERNLGSVFHIVQSLASVTVAPPQLFLVTQNAQQVSGSEALTVEQSPLWGLGRVIALEQGQCWGGLIDLERTAGVDAQVQNLFDELWKSQPGPGEQRETQVAYRNGFRYVARLARSKARASESPIAVRADAHYLVTGGLGALGLLAANWLAERGARHITLTGRSGITSENQRATLKQLEDRGVHVQVAEVDVADEAAMRRLFAEMSAEVIPLKGVFHAAGVLDDGILINQSWPRVAAVLAAKVAGGWLLHQLTRALDLDFLVLYSSAVSLLGNAGQGSYAAANAFLDGLARHRRQQGLPGLSINWGIWADVGMATRKERVRFDGFLPMAPELAMQALTQLLTHTPLAGQVGVLAVDWSRFASADSPPQPFLSHFVKKSAQARKPIGQAALFSELQARPQTSRLSHLRGYLQQVVSLLLGMSESPGLTTGFAAMGMDSLMAMKLRRQLEGALACPLPATIALEYPTVEALATHLLEHVLKFDAPSAAAGSAASSQPSHALAQPSEPIAVLSMACRFPGADTPEAFWHVLTNGVDRVTEIPPSRWNVDAYYDKRRPTPGKMYVREAGFVEHAEDFDPLFFGIAPREVASMDPQHWLLLEVSWEALERAGLAQSTLIESQTGVFVGIGVSQYGSLSDPQNLGALDNHAITSGAHSVAAGRLAYTLGLQGPTMAVDTACSSSLVTLHLACQSLRDGECDLALAGGVNLMLSPLVHVALSQMQVLAPDGRCKAFDAAADGYGRGEGGAMVVLKRLRDAERDGDPVLAVIRGSAINHDGPSSGLTVPNRHAQEKLVRKALAAARVVPDEICYVEAHGTGTPLGDPIELHALGSVFGNHRPHPLLVGTVKSNIGHLEAAAGIAGFVKTVLALQHGQIPPQLHFRTPSPYIEWDAFSIEVPTTCQPWPRAFKESIAGISSFGISGTNAHLIVAAAPPRPGEINSPPPSRKAHLLTLSAKSDAALSALAARYQEYLKANPDMDLGAICRTAALGRNHFMQRLAVVATSPDDLARDLAVWQRGDKDAEVLRGHSAPSPPGVAFLFTGQGSQYVGMGRELYETEPTFRATLDRCAALLHGHLGVPLLALLYPESSVRDSLLSDTRYTQPALFAIEYALATLWQSFGVKPAALLGHSVGELVAACVAGVFSLEDGLKLIAARGRLMSALPQGGEMISLRADGRSGRALTAQVEHAISQGPGTAVSIAALNSPTSVVISGERNAVRAVAAELAGNGVKGQRLAVSHAFHSSLMEPMLAEFAEIAKTIAYHPPQIPLISNLTGTLATEAEGSVTDWRYWVRHVREAVRFADGVAALHAQGMRIFLEVGPKPVLLGLAKEYTENATGASPPQAPRISRLFLPTLREQGNDGQELLRSLGALYVQGVEIDWRAVQKESTRNQVPLPTYPFQRQRSWVPRQKSRHADGLSPLIDKRTYLPLQRQTAFETELGGERFPFLTEHRVYGAIVSPAACQLTIACSAAALFFGPDRSIGLSDVVLPQALVLPEGATRSVQTVVGAEAAFSLISFASESPQEAGADFRTHATGRVLVLTPPESRTRDLAALRQHCLHADDIAAHYARAAAAQIELGPSFRWLAKLWQGSAGPQAEALGKLVVPDTISTPWGDTLHPGLLDACFQVASTARSDRDHGETLLPFAVGRLHLLQPAEGETFFCHAIQCGKNTWNIELLDEHGTLLAAIDGFVMRPATALAVRGHEAYRDWLYEVAWQPRPTFGLLPEYLLTSATPRILAEPLRTAAAALWQDAGGEAYERFIEEIEKKSVDYVCAALAKSGFTFRPGTRLRTAQIAQQVGVIPSYHRLLQRLLSTLADAGILRREGEVWHVLQSPPKANSRPLELSSHAGYSAPEWLLLSRCGEALSEVLRGVQEPLELLFPGGDSTIANRLYSESLRHRVMNGLIQQAVSAVVSCLPEGRGLRIVEVGAGTGGTTAGLLPLLPPARTDYVFTDLGLSFLSQAQARFVEYPFIRYQTLDIEQAPATQGVREGQADLVIAANVLHATADLHATLSHVRALLQPGGQLVLLEATHCHHWVDLTFGLTEGWWRFADERHSHPLLTASEWRALLLQSGFASVEVIEQGGLAILLAQTPAFPSGQVARVTPSEPENKWLLFADSQGLAERLATELRQRGEAAVSVFAGPRYQKLDAQTFELRPDCAADYEQLLAACPRVAGIVHMFGLASPALPGEVDLLSAAQPSCESVLKLVQALLRANIAPTEGLWLLTQDAQAVTDGDKMRGVAQAGLWGMGRVIALEHPELSCVRIDLASQVPSAELAARLCAELTTAAISAPREDQIALRASGRYVARLQHLALRPAGMLVCQSDATYLITGGLGGLGLATAAFLADRGAKQLLLIGRNPPTDAAQRQLDALAARGIHVNVAQADVSDRAQLARALLRIDPACPLRGIFHSVGVLRDGALVHQSWTRFSEVLAPKVQGAFHLHELTKTLPLDFFVLYSAGAGLLGNRGQANHAAANTLLDAFACFRRAQGLKALAIDWGPWSEIGAAAELLRKTESELKKRGLGEIAPQHGMAALEALLTSERLTAQVGVIPIDWQQLLQPGNARPPFFAEFAVERKERVEPTHAGKQAGPPPLDEQLMLATPSERAELLWTYLQESVARTLHMKSLPDPQIGFSELGMDSLLAIEFRKRIEKGLGISLPSTIAFEYPTVETLSGYVLLEIESRLPQAAVPAAKVDDAEAAAFAGDADVAEKLLKLEALLGE